MAASMKNTSDEYTISFLNSEIDSLKSLQKLKDVAKCLRAKKANLEQQLSLASSEVPSEIEKAINEAEKSRNKVKELGDRKEKLDNEIFDQIQKLQPLVDEASRLTNDVDELEKFSKYLSYIIQVDRLSADIQRAVEVDDVTKGVELFMELTSLFSLLHGSSCRNLINFARETTLFWYKILKDKIAKEFEEVLKLMKWPLISLTIKSPTAQNPGEVKMRMEHLFKQLLKLQLPDSLCNEGQGMHPVLSQITGLRPPILPLDLMLKPLRKRFRYHFYGKKQTNDLGKPEWYFTQVLSWIRDHMDFLDQRIQALLREAGKTSIDAKVEFMKGMVALVMEKMVTDLPELMYDEHQFSHLVDEAILFDREIRTAYGYSSAYPGSLHILTEGDAFEKWLLIEKKFAIEKLDAMMSSPTAWESQYRIIADVDDMKVPECGESFMTLMLTMTDRYKPLPHPSHKLRFLDLQLELLEDFRMRVVQVKDNTHNPLGEKFCAIMNTAYYITEVLREWSELIFFLQLQYYRTEYAKFPSAVNMSHLIPSNLDLSQSLELSKISDDENDPNFQFETTVFDDMINLFDRLHNDMLKSVVDNVFTDVKARSKPYRDDRWMSLPYEKDISLGLSTSACEMLLVLKDHILEVGEMISKPLFNSFWQRLAEKMNKFLFEELVMWNNFSQGGAAQLQFDMTRNLFPLFGEYTSKPDTYFREMKEVCILLNLNVGSAILLKDMLNEALHKPSADKEKKSKEVAAALHEAGVFKLTLDQAELILSKRTNLIT